VKTWAWQLTLTDEKRNISFARLFGLRLVAEAGGQVGIIGQIFGDGFRVSLLSQRMPMSSAPLVSNSRSGTLYRQRGDDKHNRSCGSWRDSSVETAGIRFRLLARNDLRLPVLLVYLWWPDDRPGQELRNENISGKLRAARMAIAAP
jgi:hypothetical protein